MVKVFTALDLPLEVKDYLFELERKLKDTKLAKVKWTNKKNLHITLKFLGDVSEKEIEKLKLKFKDIKHSKFKLKLKQLGYYPGEDRIKVIWVGVQDEKNIIELQKLIDADTMKLGDLNLGGHITLGRIKSLKEKNKYIKKIKEFNLEKLEFEVSSFTFYKSDSSKDGPIYTKLETYSLN